MESEPQKAKDWPELRKMTEQECEIDPGIIILYADDATIDTILNLPQAAAIPALCRPGTVPYMYFLLSCHHVLSKAILPGIWVRTCGGLMYLCTQTSSHKMVFIVLMLAHAFLNYVVAAHRLAIVHLWSGSSKTQNNGTAE